MCVWRFFILNKCVPGMLVSIDTICLHLFKTIYLIQHHFISCLFCPQFLCISMISLCRWPHSHWGIFSESLNWYHLAIYSFTPGPMASFDWPFQPVPFYRFLFFCPFVLKMKEIPSLTCCVMVIISCKSSASQHIVYFES